MADASSKSAVLAVIPSRYGSTRFPGKPLAAIQGKPMIEHVYRRAALAKRVDRVVVATDDERIFQAVQAFGGQALMTGSHPTGTDRIAEAARLAGAGQPGGPQWVLNVQGDEPLLDPADLDTLVEGLEGLPDAVMGTLIYALKEEEYSDPNVVKVVTNNQGRALYFSRSPIPFRRGAAAPGWRHMGIYLFRAGFLQTFAALPQTPLAESEQLEQLRALEYGYPIHCFQARTFSIGVDVPEDIQRAEKLLAGQA